MTRDELITLAINARVLANEDEIDSVLDVLEPVIRADEREKVNVSWKNDFDAEMDGLHGKIKTLPKITFGKSVDYWIRRAAVLALLGDE
jgi:hypothetical protein